MARCVCLTWLMITVVEYNLWDKIMIIKRFVKTLLFLTVLMAFAGVAFGQDTKPPDGQKPADNQPQDVRANALRQLGLSRDQIQQIRMVNAERKPLMAEAQRRLREANLALDEAIYSDHVSESDVQARLKEAQSAQAEVARIRYMNELSVRKILTTEQLVRFRELRRSFEQERVQNRIQNREQGQGAPIRRQLIQNGQTLQPRPNANPKKVQNNVKNPKKN